MGLKNYDPKQIIVTFQGNILTGFMEGSFLTAERNEDTFEKSVGADGETTRVRKNDRSGILTLTLQAESPSNDVLSALAELDELSGLGFGAVMIKDLQGTTLIASAQAWVRKPANAEFADTASSREWVIEAVDLVMGVGSALI